MTISLNVNTVLGIIDVTINIPVLKILFLMLYFKFIINVYG